jgi:ribosome biogenesis GTPase / thiamine phosphate phosphatase
MSSARTGLVVETQRRHFFVQSNGDVVRCVARGRQLSISCGDEVSVERSGASEGTITAVAARTTVFYRADEFKQKIVAANVTQVVCVIAADPPFAPSLLDRWLVAARAAGTRVVVVFNKTDVVGAEAALASLTQTYGAAAFLPIAMSAKQSVDALRPLLRGEKSVLIGQSGMGKSTILNALVGADVRAVGELSAVRAAGTHTTTHSKLFHLDEHSWVIDSPGMQVFGIAHLSRTDVERSFDELAPFLGRCRFRNCQHAPEPGCALQAGVEAGKILPSRFQSFLALCAEARA